VASTNEVQLIIPKSIQARFVPYSCGAVSKTERAVGFTSIIIFGFGDLDGLDFFSLPTQVHNSFWESFTMP